MTDHLLDVFSAGWKRLADDTTSTGEAGHGRVPVGHDVLPGVHAGGHHPLLQPPAVDIVLMNIVVTNIVVMNMVMMNIVMMNMVMMNMVTTIIWPPGLYSLSTEPKGLTELLYILKIYRRKPIFCLQDEQKKRKKKNLKNNRKQNLLKRHIYVNIYPYH